ncbi:PREDICTED: uncharacterized protein LOC108764261 [Trachymyrmex cornetzi]|uniref:uncharacterized protein LOC108764261 n=1 Tax=Trachymyrmex cornetzi TaxID=471704 RepID=UPI00084EE1A8|nr:PREDICTED: uncharacterized protein LOC108764261 [Trachymyrmex cornetzi]
MLQHDIWQTLDRITYEQAAKTLTLSSKRQKQKYINHPSQKSTTFSTQRQEPIQQRPVLRYYGCPTSALAKGPNFAVAPRKVPKEKIISQIEPTIYRLPSEQTDNIRRQVTNILSKAKPPPPNITRQERLALQDLNRDTDIIVLPADKGNTTVVTSDYKKKIKNLLSDKAYKMLDRDPTDTIAQNTKILVEKSNISNETKTTLKPTNPLPPRLYGLPKVHKSNISLRPIVSAIHSPTYNLSRFLARTLQPLTEKTESHITNSTDFIQKIQKIRLRPIDLLVSFDVESLFTQVPIKDTLNIIKASHEVPLDLIPLIEHCLTSTYFSYNNQFYEQTSGAVMGSPISPVIVNIFMEHFEKEALRKTSKKPEVWFRYVRVAQPVLKLASSEAKLATQPIAQPALLPTRQQARKSS